MGLSELFRCARLLQKVLRKNDIRPSAPHSIYYVRRVSSQPTPHYGDLFGQAWEPAGEYMTPVDGPRDPNELRPHGEVRGAAGRTWFEHGQVHFQNPVVVHRGQDDLVGWKRMLSQHFGGKTGARLSAELRRRGHDGVVVKDPSGQQIDEVVNLTGAKDIIQPFPAEAQRYLGPRRSPRVWKSERLQKMALRDNKPGVLLSQSSFGDVYDYSHLLPEKERDAGLALHLTYDVHTMRSELIHDGEVVGLVNVNVYGDDDCVRCGADAAGEGRETCRRCGAALDGPAIEPHSALSPQYHGRGLGSSMYEAVFTHAVGLGINRVTNGEPSTDARKVHQRLATKHGYRAKMGQDHYDYIIGPTRKTEAGQLPCGCSWLASSKHGPVGRHGDYLLHPHVDGHNCLSVTAYHARCPHPIVGEAQFVPQFEYVEDEDGFWTGERRVAANKGWDVRVHPDHRRRGLASAMYRHAELVGGVPVAAGDFQTPDGEGFLAGKKIAL